MAGERTTWMQALALTDESPPAGGSPNTSGYACCLLYAAGFDNVAKANRHMTRDEARPVKLTQT